MVYLVRQNTKLPQLWWGIPDVQLCKLVKMSHAHEILCS